MTVAAATAAIDTPEMRCASAQLLSLALMDARNHTLHLLGRFQEALGDSLRVPAAPDVLSPLRVAGHIGWLAERWIGRNPQRALGAACPADGVRLASVQPLADEWFDPTIASQGDPPGLDVVKGYLLETLETTLELLDKAAEDDAGLYFFRMALFHEDVRGEQLVSLAQTLGVPLGLALPMGVQSREPLLLPASRWRMGWTGGGFALDIEQGALEVDVPEFEIDAQPVTWSQYVEFIADGGYDCRELWSADGWEWLQHEPEGRRGPRHVEQIGIASGAVMLSLFGKPARMAGAQSVMHVSWWEADAYARWAGRRLPTEAEWEIAAHQAARRGFRWGDVHEWTAGTLRPWPGFQRAAWAVDAGLDAQPLFGKARVLRGASFAARSRMKHVKARGWALPGFDAGFVGFRTSAI